MSPRLTQIYLDIYLTQSNTKHSACSKIWQFGCSALYSYVQYNYDNAIEIYFVVCNVQRNTLQFITWFSFKP